MVTGKLSAKNTQEKRPQSQAGEREGVPPKASPSSSQTDRPQPSSAIIEVVAHALSLSLTEELRPDKALRRLARP